MHFIDIILIGIALSMDAFAVSVSDSLIYKKYSPIMIALFFGVFQGLMPLLGFYTGSLFADFINTYSGWITLIILGTIGGKMIFDTLRPQAVSHTTEEKLTFRMLLIQAIATSIDAFAVGVSFVGADVNIVFASAVIAIITFLLSRLAIAVGQKSGSVFGNKPGLAGGIILILIGLKAILF